MNSPCERCGQRPHVWFTNVGYLCDPCCNEWELLDHLVLSKAQK